MLIQDGEKYVTVEINFKKTKHLVKNANRNLATWNGCNHSNEYFTG